MSAISFLLIFVPALSIILLILNIVLAVTKPDSQKISPFECGFSGFTDQTRAPFSVQFYLVGLLFLIFDLEILFIYPFAVSFYQISFTGFWIIILFLAILTIGFVYEFSKGVLSLTSKQTDSISSRPGAG